MNILGVHFGHDSGACVIQSGKIIAAINEERLSRVKNHTGFPEKAVEYVLEASGLSPLMIDVVAVPRSLDKLRSLKLLESLTGKSPIRGRLRDWYYFCTPQFIPDRRYSPLRITAAIDRVLSKLVFRNHFRKMGFDNAVLLDVGHHFSHASSAFFTGPWKEALVFTLDGAGDASCGGFYHGRNGQLESVKMIPMAASLGEFYSVVTKFLGFVPMRHEGKVLGLAARGDASKYINDFEKLVSLESGSLEFDVMHRSLPQERYNWRCMTGRGPLDAHRAMWMEHLTNNYNGSHQDDVAAAVQELTERRIMQLIKTLYSRHPRLKELPLCLAGGVFANVRVNMLIGKLIGNDRFYVQPNMGDGGLALGAALAAASIEAGLEPEYLSNVYLGPSYSNDDVKHALSKEKGLKFSYVEDIDGKAGEALAQDKIICRFQGAMEFGPRALGNRSILADPNDPTINDRLNHMLQRSDFMPFAPSILAEKVHDYFIVGETDRYADQFMTVTYQSTDLCKKRAPAVVHVDGTARPQVVHASVSPRYHRTISTYYDKTGTPLIVNTSFNIHEEPIVCSPENAIASFKKCGADVLAIENWWVERD